MTVLSIILLYIVGCILAYGRSFATFYEIHEDYIKTSEPKFTFSVKRHIKLTTFFSWLGFLVGIFVYFIDGERYLFKWSLKYLEERYKKPIY